MIHHLQQDIEQVRVRFFNFIQQQHGMGLVVDGVRQQPALVETNIAWRRANQP